MARVWVLSASNSQRLEVERVLTEFGLRPVWKEQPFQPGTRQCFAEQQVDSSNLASSLAKVCGPFEIEGEAERFLYHPGLGLVRQQLDDAGEIVLRTGHLKRELEASNGNLKEFERRLRLLEAQPWLDLLEPYRLGITRHTQMPKAV